MRQNIISLYILYRHTNKKKRAGTLNVPAETTSFHYIFATINYD